MTVGTIQWTGDNVPQPLHWNVAPLSVRMEGHGLPAAPVTV